MSKKREMRQKARQLLRKIREIKGIAMAYHCRCGQHVILTNFEPSALRQRVDEMRIAVMKKHDHAACPKCGAPLAPVWQASEDAMIDAVLAKLEAMYNGDLAQVLKIELRTLQEMHLKCN